MSMIAGLPLVEIPADRSGLEAFIVRQKRRQRLLIVRRHISWIVRKYQPEMAADLIRQFQAAYERAARDYMKVSHGPQSS